MFTTYEDFLHFMSLQKDRVYSLDNLQSYILTCQPQYLDIPVIHVAGTNGKGSTVNYLKTTYELAGYKVATFVSPSLHMRNDIIKVNSQEIALEKMVAIANKYIQDYLKYQLSVFEIEVCIAFEYFQEHNVDLAIIEVGLGGRLDATNFVKPLLSVITNISYDHTDFLGTTLASITKEKAGIIKENTPCISGVFQKECIHVLTEHCKQLNSPLYFVEALETKGYQSYTYHGLDIELTAIASYQLQNSALALEVIEHMQELYPVDNKTIQEAFYQAKWPGRFEQLQTNPTIIIDGAHNPGGIERFIESASIQGKGAILFAAFKDKDIQSMLDQLSKFSDDITLTTFDHPRAASLTEYPEGYEQIADFKEAINQLRETKERIYITGSLSFIALVRAYILEQGGVYKK